MRRPALLAALAAAALSLAAVPGSAGAAAARPGAVPAPVTAYGGLTTAQRSALLGIARDTWKFYAAEDGFFDAVNPATGAVGHRDLVLDQSMIMAALDNALGDRSLQRDFARDPVSWAARTYLTLERMSL
jgi:hypothetical protein